VLAGNVYQNVVNAKRALYRACSSARRSEVSLQFLVFGFWFLAFGLQFSVVVRQQRKRWRVHCNRTAKILCPQGVHAVKEQDRSGLLSNRFYAIRQVVAQCQPLILGLAATRCLHAL